MMKFNDYKYEIVEGDKNIIAYTITVSNADFIVNQLNSHSTFSCRFYSWRPIMETNGDNNV